jgi:hypothetical protein
MHGGAVNLRISPRLATILVQENQLSAQSLTILLNATKEMKIASQSSIAQTSCLSGDSSTASELNSFAGLCGMRREKTKEQSGLLHTKNLLILHNR